MFSTILRMALASLALLASQGTSALSIDKHKRDTSEAARIPEALFKDHNEAVSLSSYTNPGAATSITPNSITSKTYLLRRAEGNKVRPSSIPLSDTDRVADGGNNRSNSGPPRHSSGS
ncbi:hypothetical protein FKW77_007652 [Venturia effusa]|uniref:Uncharacterized protein n=1 Tax=Venturia effusa TaxID=50376 RepID=A0A517L9K7_9PEZI|nr:hypothetical protein FKW77_007652 [Venturia effusa]